MDRDVLNRYEASKKGFSPDYTKLGTGLDFHNNRAVPIIRDRDLFFCMVPKADSLSSPPRAGLK
jgi:hypothetical protein